jgi:hypothetical protein
VRTVNMVEIVVRLQGDPLGLLEHGMAALRSLSEQGAEESRIPQTRALVGGLIHSGALLDVAEALSLWLVERTGQARDLEVLALVRPKRSKALGRESK